MFALDDILDPTDPEGIIFIGSSGYLDDDRQCRCWFDCERPVDWPDDECDACRAGRHRNPSDPEDRR
jgi:hypothetical protein